MAVSNIKRLAIKLPDPGTLKYALMLRTTQKVKDINRRRRLGYLFTEA